MWVSHLNAFHFTYNRIDGSPFNAHVHSSAFCACMNRYNWCIYTHTMTKSIKFHRLYGNRHHSFIHKYERHHWRHHWRRRHCPIIVHGSSNMIFCLNVDKRYDHVISFILSAFAQPSSASAMMTMDGGAVMSFYSNGICVFHMLANAAIIISIVKIQIYKSK